MKQTGLQINIDKTMYKEMSAHQKQLRSTS